MSEKEDHLVDGKARAAEILKSAADSGDDEARIAFACLLNTGIGLDRNAELAADYLLAAAENGCAEAQLRLGVMYCLGEGVPQDFDQGVDWLFEAEQADLIEAAVWRGYVRVVRRKGHVKRLIELNADDVLVRNPKQLLEEAVEDLPDYSSEPWVEKENIDALRRHAEASAAGNTDSQWKFAFMLASGKGTPQDTSAAREWYLRAAEGGCRTAQFMLGDFYENNAEMMLDHPSNEEQAAFWYGEAGNQGHRPAERRLGVLAWRLGLAGENEGRFGDAVRWYTVSADLGHGIGLWKLGMAYALGKGVQRDVSKAKDLLTAASATGVAEAQFELARLHLQADFEEADPTAGRELLIQAAKNGRAEATALLKSLAGAEQGETDAQFVLGCMYSRGEGVELDYAEANRWWRKAAEQGDADAQFNLGLQYALGMGVTRDADEAARWFGKAASQGHEAAQDELKDLQRGV